jgi:hypothetical protein
MSVGKMSVGKMSVGKLSVGKMSVGKMSVGQMSVGPMSVGQMSVGQMSVGQMSVGKMYFCQMSIAQKCTYAKYLVQKCLSAKGMVSKDIRRPNVSWTNVFRSKDGNPCHITIRTCLLNLTTEAGIIKLFTAVNKYLEYCANGVITFSHFHPSLIKLTSLLRSEINGGCKKF